MPHQDSWKYAQQVGPEKARKEVVEVYDDNYGKYENEAGVKKVSSPKPAKDTKMPFGGLHGGR